MNQIAYILVVVSVAICSFVAGWFLRPPRTRIIEYGRLLRPVDRETVKRILRDVEHLTPRVTKGRENDSVPR